MSKVAIKINILNWMSILKFLRYSLLTGAILYIVVYLILAFFRLQYPFVLEWMEGGTVDHVMRILSGQQIYTRPSLEFMPFIYTPFYFYLSAFVSKFVGVGFLAPRIVSLISSIGCFILIFLTVKRETKNSFPAILSSCLFAATFQISGAWFDIARADSLFLFLLLMSIYISRFYTTNTSAVVAALFVWLSFLTKQIALPISLTIALFYILKNRRQSVFFIGTFVFAVVVSTLFLNYLSNGWYTYYVFDLPTQHTIVIPMYLVFWCRDLFLHIPIACLLSLSFFILPHRTSINEVSENPTMFYCLIAIGMIGASLLSRLHSGGYSNVLFPAYAIISIIFGLSIQRLFEFVKVIHNNYKSQLLMLLYLACIIQFLALAYNPMDQIPKSCDLEAGEELIDKLKRVEGEIWIPCQGYYPTLAGKNTSAQWAAVDDVLRGDDTQIKDSLVQEIKTAIRERRFNMIILDSKNNPFTEDINKYYQMKEEVFGDPTVFWPVTGARIRSELIYIPNGNDTNKVMFDEGTVSLPKDINQSGRYID